MAIVTIRCQACGKMLQASSEFAGRKAACPKCQTPFEIPCKDLAGSDARTSNASVASKSSPSTPKSPQGNSGGALGFPRPIVATAVGAILFVALTVPLLIAGIGSGQSKAGSREASPDSVATLPAPSESSDFVCTLSASSEREEAGTEGSGRIERVSRSVVLLSTDKGTLGTGFVVSQGDAVATNWHVVEGASAITATFNDGRKVDIIGFLQSAPEHDLVLLRLAEQSDAPPLVIADRDAGLGTDVYAVGMPKGLAFSVSKGVLSGYRSWPEVESVLESDVGADADFHIDTESRWVQTTTPISPGNSGGPLLNLEGEVIGVNTMRSISSSSQNLNFAIDRSHVASLVNQPMQKTFLLTKLPARSDSGTPVVPPSSGPSDNAASLYEADREAWDHAAMAVGQFYLTFSVRVMELQSCKPETGSQLDDAEERAFTRGIAAAALVACEKLHRINPETVSKPLATYVEGLTDALGTISQNAIAEAQNKPVPGGESGADTMERLQSMVDAISPSVKSRLEWIHKKPFRGPQGLAEDDLTRVAHLRSGMVSLGVRKKTLDCRVLWGTYEQILWDTYERASYNGRGEGALRMIVSEQSQPFTDIGVKAYNVLQMIENSKEKVGGRERRGYGPQLPDKKW